MSAWRRLVVPGDLVFQVGAGDGASVASLLAAGARVVAVEADPARARALRARFSSAVGVSVIERGLANRPARLPAAGVAIEITTLDLLLRELDRPRYCRLDVGGDPGSILDGLSASGRLAIPLVSFEFKAAQLEGLRRAVARLAALGYRQFDWARWPDGEFLAPPPAIVSSSSSPSPSASPFTAGWLDAPALVDAITRAARVDGGGDLRGEVLARAPAPERFAVSILRQPGNIHSECFRELADTVTGALVELGHDAISSEEIAVAGRRNIVFGSNLIANLDTPVVFAPGSILYNLEQIYEGSPWLTAELLAALRAHTVWDYSRANILALARLGISARHVPVGYAPALTRIPPAPAQDIDVLFIGSIAERRLNILQALEREGARVVAIYGRYGAERDALIARAKIVLNIHFHAAKVFEIVRVSYLLANRCFVVSETGSDRDSEAELAGGVVFTDYDRLVATCLGYLGDPAARAQVAARGFTLMSSLRETDFLRPVVGGA